MTVAASISRDACRPAEVGPAKAHTISDEMRKAGPATAGFDYLRIGLALAVVAWHSVALSTGSEALVQSLWTGRLHFLLVAILPMFFGLSGFLVAGSLARTRLHQFVMLRALRLVPALAVEVTLSALILGPVFTLLPLRRYFSSPEFFQYFGNIVGLVRFTLPEVFETNPVTRLVNPQLWTVPFELECYFALVTLSVTGVLNSRRACVGLVALLSVAGTACALSILPIGAAGALPGRVLVLSFLAAVCLHLYRDKIPYATVLGVGSAVAAAALLQRPNASYLAAFPVAYLTVWLGLMRPPKIPFGDLSYGVYLFHYPVEQAVMHLFPDIGSWWRLTLAALPPTLVCAWLSWTLVERPVLSRKAAILKAADRALAAGVSAGWFSPGPDSRRDERWDAAAPAE